MPIVPNSTVGLISVRPQKLVNTLVVMLSSMCGGHKTLVQKARYLYIKSETLTFPRDLRCHKEIAHFPKHRKEALRFYKGSEKLRKTGKLTT